MIAFLLMAIIAVGLAIASCTDNPASICSSLPFIILWAVATLAACIHIFRRKLFKRPAAMALHISFAIILAGALCTHLFGTSETIHLREGQSKDIGDMEVKLEKFSVVYYPGTQAPADFVSEICVNGQPYTVAMNRIANVNGYRFCHMSYDSDNLGTAMIVSHDPWGITLSYAGYIMLALSMILLSLPNRKHKHNATFIRGAAASFAVALTIPTSLAASGNNDMPGVLPRNVAAKMGQLLVYHNDHVAPLSVLAHDFTLKLTGTDSYRGLTPEQVMTGWLFFYEDWKKEPCIFLKEKASLKAIGKEGSRIALTDFFDAANGYRFQDSQHPEANEKFSIASMAAAGSIWKIFPWPTGNNGIEWLSPVDDTPPEMPIDDWRMTRHSLNYLAELVSGKQWNEASACIDKIAKYQQIRGGDNLPSATRSTAELLFINLADSPVAAAVMLIGGIWLLFPVPRRRLWGMLLLCAGALWEAFLIALNWIASGSLPMADGYETMQWMALSACIIAALMSRKEKMMLPLGAVVAAMAMMVAMIGHRNPQVTQVMPVLRSPLLSIHVMAVMLAYALLALMALCGIVWLCGHKSMLAPARKMLRPAVFLLAAGIFIGAVWANVSWGRYWGWDPKEIWALITMLVYSAPLHPRTLPRLNNDKAFAIWCIAAFSCVIVTYFGVNFILGGLHGYA